MGNKMIFEKVKLSDKMVIKGINLIKDKLSFITNLKLAFANHLLENI